MTTESEPLPAPSPNPLRSIKGRVAVVTGAASGIGRATVHALRNEGALVGALDISFPADHASTATSSEANTDTLLRRRCDVSSETSVIEAVAAVRSHFGPIDIVVNNAGVSIATPIADPSFEDGWLRTLEVNLTGQTRLIRACLDDLLRNNDGRIVNIASTEALGGTGGMSAYTASKHGVAGLTRSLAVELGKSGVTVNAVCPGPINTGMTQGIPDENKAIFGRRATAVRRYGEPHEVADVIVSLTLPSATYITGAVVPVDGGMTARNQ